MKPNELKIKGFLSYQNEVSIDLSSIHTACISGSNGSGKSSILDAITWSIFGQARKRDESIINNQSDTAEITIEFEYEGNTYRVFRQKRRGKTGRLEFHIVVGMNSIPTLPEWKPLTEASMRETQEKIETVLRLDYETFVNASFFLQGGADQFTQHKPADRKRILANILDLGLWEVHRLNAANERKVQDEQLSKLTGKIAEVQEGISLEPARKRQLEESQSELVESVSMVGDLESALEVLREHELKVSEIDGKVKVLRSSHYLNSNKINDINTGLTLRNNEFVQLANTLNRSGEIEDGYHDLAEARLELSKLDDVAQEYNQQELEREKIRSELAVYGEKKIHCISKANRKEELSTLINQKQIEIDRIAVSIDSLSDSKSASEELKKKYNAVVLANGILKERMNEIKSRIDILSDNDSAECDACGQPIDQDRIAELVEQLTADGKILGDEYRESNAEGNHIEMKGRHLEAKLYELSQMEIKIASLEAEMNSMVDEGNKIDLIIIEWEDKDAPEFDRLRGELDRERVDNIIFSPEDHADKKQHVQELQHWDAKQRELDKVVAASEPLEREIKSLVEQLESLSTESKRIETEIKELEYDIGDPPDNYENIARLETDLIEMQEVEHSCRSALGACQQRVDEIAELKDKKAIYDQDKESAMRLIGQYKQIEKAFGKQGVPAMLIENAIPQIEGEANTILERLTGGELSLRFVTQREYKDKNREDMKETLDIVINDANGARDYEMYSGGEAFRINFAVRLALSKVLAHRAGAKLQTLVIDEGFGSQDELGRQRLVEAIGMVKDDYERILVITHIDSLKEAFETRIEVVKNGNGSSVEVIR